MKQGISEHGIAETAERIKRGERRPVAAHCESETIVLQQAAEAAEIEGRRLYG